MSFFDYRLMIPPCVLSGRESSLERTSRCCYSILQYSLDIKEVGSLGGFYFFLFFFLVSQRRMRISWPDLGQGAGGGGRRTPQGTQAL